MLWPRKHHSTIPQLSWQPRLSLENSSRPRTRCWMQQPQPQLIPQPCCCPQAPGDQNALCTGRDAARAHSQAGGIHRTRLLGKNVAETGEQVRRQPAQGNQKDCIGKRYAKKVVRVVFAGEKCREIGFVGHFRLSAERAAKQENRHSLNIGGWPCPTHPH